MDKIIKLQFNTTVNKRVKVRTNCELYSHDKNNNEFELTIGNHTLTNEEIIILFKFVKSIKYWETQGRIEDNKIKFKFDTSLITDNERVNCYIILKNEAKESDVYSFSFDVKMSEYDLKNNLPIKERYFANSVVVDKLDVLTKEVLATELEKAKGTYALKSDLSEFVRTSDISDVVRTATLNDYQLKSEMPNVTEIVNNTIDSKGFITTHQSLVDYAKKSELPIDYVSNAKLEELKTQLTIDTSNFATKQELQAITGSQQIVDTSNLVTKDELNSKNYLTEHQSLEDYVTKSELDNKHYLTAHQDISNLATKQELQEVSNRQVTVDTSNLVTKDELASKGYLTTHQSLEEYAKKTELPQPYNDTDIKSRLTTLENRPAGNVDTSNLVSRGDLTTLELTINRKLNGEGGIFTNTGYKEPFQYFQDTRVGNPQNYYGRIYSNNTERIIISNASKYTNLDTALYTLASSIPDGYTPDFEFSESDNLKFITTQNIHNYIPANTGNTTELDKRLKVLEANTGNTTELDKRLKAIESNPANTTELDNRLKVLEAKQWEIHGRGMPNGTVAAPVGTTYVDEAVTNGALKWIKKSGTGNTGWEVLIGDTGWRTLPAVSKLGNSFVKVRRKNDTIFYQFGGLSWGWFGVVRRGGAGYQLQGSDRERNCYILGLNGVPQGFRSESSLIGGIYNDKGTPYGTWYLGGAGDSHMLRFQFTDPVPTDRDIGDIRVSSISYLTNDPWPQN
jgi:hypothetical protein|nr:MAG TPA: hypothetical protein [Caudoviricetes sp.]